MKVLHVSAFYGVGNIIWFSQKIFILRLASVKLWRRLWDQDLLFLVDSNSWRGLTKYFG